MVAPQLFDDDAQSASLSPPPIAPPPKRFRRGLFAAVAAVTIAGGAGSGALAATLVDHSTPTTTASTGTTTSSSTTSTSTQASTTAEAVYKQVSPGVVTITAVVNSGRGSGQATGSGIVLDTNGNVLTNAHVIAGPQQIQVTFSDHRPVTATLVGSHTGPHAAVIAV